MSGPQQGCTGSVARFSLCHLSHPICVEYPKNPTKSGIFLMHAGSYTESVLATICVMLTVHATQVHIV